MTFGQFAIKGNHVNRLAEIFSFFKLIDTGEDQILTNWAETSKILEKENLQYSNTSQQHLVFIQNGWTVIEDLKMNLCYDTEALQNISSLLNQPVFSCFVQTTSSNHAFYYFDKIKARAYHFNDGIIEESFGSPLEQEKDIDLTDNVSCVYDLTTKLGLDWESSKYLDKYIFKTLTNSPELQAELDKYKPEKKEPNKNNRPWWKFW
ncbi:MAG: hypothetical protein V4608_15260 [Bacteroidota bacterium]